MSERGPRCAEVAQTQALDPIGSAPPGDVLVVLSIPLPWPAMIEDAPLVAALRPLLDRVTGRGRDYRIQATPASVSAPIDVAVHRFRRRLDDGPTCDRYRIPSGELATAVSTAASDGDLDRWRATPDAAVDVLVCSHGARDTCCGSLGTRLAVQADSDHGVRVARTSHLGGHRYAPTGLTLRDGRYWAFLDAATLDGIVTRTVPVEQAMLHYRGSAGISAAAQVVERAAFLDHGWAWLDHHWSADDGAAAGTAERREVRMRTRSPEGGAVSYVGTVAVNRTVDIPGCGSTAPTVVEELCLESLTRTDAW